MFASAAQAPGFAAGETRNIKDDFPNCPLGFLSFVDSFSPPYNTMVQLLHFDVATGLYSPGGSEIAGAVRRALSHPTTVGFVKRAVSSNGESEGEHMDMPTWGIVLLGVSFYASIVAMSLVSTSASPPQSRDLLKC